MWTLKKPEMNSRRTLRAPCGGSKNAFTVGNGHHPEVTPGRGRRRETGGSRGCLAPAGGPRCQTAGQPARSARDQARSPPSHTWRGPSSCSATMPSSVNYQGLVHRRGRPPVPPAGMDSDQPGRSRRDADQLGPGVQLQPGGDRFPPGLAAEQPGEQLRRPGGRPEDELGRGRLADSLPAEVTGDPQRGPPVGERGVRGQAVEDDRVAGLGNRPRKNRYPSPASRRRNPSWSFSSDVESASSSTCPLYAAGASLLDWRAAWVSSGRRVSRTSA